MPREGKLRCGCEDAHAMRATSFRWENEGSLGQIEFSRDALHLYVCEPLRVGNYGQRVPSKPLRCEYIERVKWDGTRRAHVLPSLLVGPAAQARGPRWQRPMPIPDVNDRPRAWADASPANVDLPCWPHRVQPRFPAG